MAFKNLYGLFFYKLQFTSFFSIMQRITGFFLIFFIIFVFFFDISYYLKFYFKSYYGIEVFIDAILLYLSLYFFVFHFLNGLRVFFISSFYFHTFSNRLVGANLNFFSFLINTFSFSKHFKDSKDFFNNFLLKNFKFILTFYLKLLYLLKVYFIKSKFFFIFISFFFYVLSISLIL